MGHPPLLLSTEFVHGWSARVTSGIAVDIAGRPKLSVGSEIGGLGSNQFTTWSVRGPAPPCRSEERLRRWDDWSA